MLSRKFRQRVRFWRSQAIPNNGPLNMCNCGSLQRSNSSSLSLSRSVKQSSMRTVKRLCCLATKILSNVPHMWVQWRTTWNQSVNWLSWFYSFRLEAYCMHNWRYGKPRLSIRHILIAIYWRHRQLAHRRTSHRAYHHSGTRCSMTIVKLATVCWIIKLCQLLKTFA